MSTLDNTMITFGRYKNKKLPQLLRDRKYCSWLLEQDWFERRYTYLHNRIKEYDPKDFFLTSDKGDTPLSFVNDYPYFNLRSAENLPHLTEEEKTCYLYYLSLIEKIRKDILDRTEIYGANPYDIKAPVRWLQRFEREHQIPRDFFKEFLYAYELPNIPYIIEDVKKEGGIIYNGARSFLIAKKKSEEQEEWWEKKLKEKYGEDIGTQFKYRSCVFDFLSINRSTIYECKLNLVDLNMDQYRKYCLVLEPYKIIYLIGRDTIVDMAERRIYTAAMEHFQRIPIKSKQSKLILKILEFDIEELEDEEELLDFL